MAASPQVRANALRSYLDVANLLGINGRRLLAEVGLHPSQLADSEARIPASAGVRLLEKSAEAAGCDSFGVRMAQCRSFASLGPVSLLLQHLANIREVIEAMAAYQRSIADTLGIDLQVIDEVAVISFDAMPPYNWPQAIDLTVGVAFAVLDGVSNGGWKPEAVHFTHKRPSDVAPFEALFRTSLQFDSSFNGFSCPASALGIALPRADRPMAENAARLLGQMALPPRQATLCERVRHAITLLLPSGRATLEAVAANVELSPRTLQRELTLQGETYGDLLNAVRRELAERYLAGSSRSITDVSAQLGYSSATSFTRWFHASFGMSPTSWRNLQQSRAAGPPPLWKV